MVDEILKEMSPKFQKLYSDVGRPSIAPERLLRSLLLQILYSVRSERMLIEQLQYNLLFRWFVGMEMDEAVWWAADKAENLARCKSSFRQLPIVGRIAYPMRAKVATHAQLGRKSLGCPAEDLFFAAVGTIWEASKHRGLNITK